MDYTTIPPSQFVFFWQHPHVRTTNVFDSRVEAFVFLDINSNLMLEGDFPYVLRISDSKFSSVNVSESNFSEKITFRDCIFEGDFNVDGGNFKSTLHFLNCEFQADFIIRIGDFDTLMFDNCTFAKRVKISGGIFKKLIYVSANEKSIFNVNGRFTFIKFLKLVSTVGLTFFTKHCVINEVSIEGYYNSYSRLDFSEIKCNSVKINNVNNDGKIYFSNFNHCLVAEIKPTLLSEVYVNPGLNDEEESLHHEITRLGLADNIKLYNNFFFSSLCKELLYNKTKAASFIFDSDFKNKSFFDINNCSLGVVELRDIPLENMRVKALSSDLSSLKLINTKFPLRIDSYNVLNEYYVYNDIYTSANRQNNYRDKIEYYRVSQQALLKNIINEGRLQSLPSYISILVSKFASNHGSNWGQALLVTVMIGTLFFSLFVLSFDNISFDFSDKGFVYLFDKVLPYLPQFFNPLHKIEFMDDVDLELGGWTNLVDILGRLFVSIGIFEMVRSFRKYVRT